jgi:hypothetical protein
MDKFEIQKLRQQPKSNQITPSALVDRYLSVEALKVRKHIKYKARITQAKDIVL